jgi:hypothetical protein
MLNFIDKTFPYILGTMIGILFIFAIYQMGVRNTRDAICDQVGGIYISTPNGNKCIMVTEIPLP